MNSSNIVTVHNNVRSQHGCDMHALVLITIPVPAEVMQGWREGEIINRKSYLNISPKPSTFPRSTQRDRLYTRPHEDSREETVADIFRGKQNTQKISLRSEKVNFSVSVLKSVRTISAPLWLLL